MPKRKYSIAFKMEVLEYMATGKTGYAAWKYFCNRDSCIHTQSMFNKWYRNRELIAEQIATGGADKCRIRGGGRKPFLHDAEATLKDEINSILESEPNYKITRQFIASRGLEIARAIGLADFRASSHWVKSFMSRNGFELMSSKAFARLKAFEASRATATAYSSGSDTSTASAIDAIVRRVEAERDHSDTSDDVDSEHSKSSEHHATSLSAEGDQEYQDEGAAPVAKRAKLGLVVEQIDRLLGSDDHNNVTVNTNNEIKLVASTEITNVTEI